MPTLTVSGYAPITAQPGERLVVALERGGVDILHRCGGVAKCTSCRVEITSGEPSQMTEAERDKLAEKGMSGVRLACQMVVDGDMSLTPVQTEQNSGLEAGKAVAEQIEPAPVWVDKA